MLRYRFILAAFACVYVSIATAASGQAPIPKASTTNRTFQYRLPSKAAHWWVADLRPAATYKSNKPRADYNVTLAIQYTFNRLGALKLQCQTWKGIISAAVYVPLREGGLYAPNKPQNGWAPSLVLNWLVGVYNGTEKGCILDMAIYTEELPEDPLANEFWRVPVNAMRNLAMAMVQTPVVGIVDADFVVGPSSFISTLWQPESYQQIRKVLEYERGLYIMPALEHNASALSLEQGLKVIKEVAQAATKDTAIKYLRQRQLKPFHHQYHLFTDYDRWANAMEPYEIYFPAVPSSGEVLTHKGHLYEPYVLAWRAYLPEPMFDERFRGYHLNKVQGLAYLSFQPTFRWYVHPQAFVLHCPHPVAKEDRRKDIQSDKSKQLESIWDAEISSHAQETRPFKPVVSHGTAHMYTVLQGTGLVASVLFIKRQHS